MPVGLSRLHHNDPNYKLYKKQFLDGWQHPEKTARVKDIYFVNSSELKSSNRGTRFSQYMSANGGTFRNLFHGTQRACRAGEAGGKLELCRSGDCKLCLIFRSSFKIKYASPRNMYGPGIYTTPMSSKADNFTRNHNVDSQLYGMLICRVVCSRPQYVDEHDSKLSAPDSGFNCVEALTVDRGGEVNYPEVIVYRDDAIIPVGLVVYARTDDK